MGNEVTIIITGLLFFIIAGVFGCLGIYHIIVKSNKKKASIFFGIGFLIIILYLIGTFIYL
ncbi:hypothetical protein [Desertibacillus haloalkaliphilus]|uniref:hypothetical protein n=1 Tax=Desertibacillus haloalkaliphilus TaxID=1328930 RepID=UPI001C263E6F|nr:hypothetical protein [Desertibacillus haloalkaliphilus]MBU8907337.1 hypothetical protein [Desertibacillus haloalkaliphilus]